MKLSEDLRYSQKEKKLFNIVSGYKKGVESKTLVEKYYSGKIPLNGQRAVMSGVRDLKKKIDHYREPFKIAISERRGPWPVTISIEKRGRA